MLLASLFITKRAPWVTECLWSKDTISPRGYQNTVYVTTVEHWHIIFYWCQKTKECLSCKTFMSYLVTKNIKILLSNTHLFLGSLFFSFLSFLSFFFFEPLSSSGGSSTDSLSSPINSCDFFFLNFGVWSVIGKEYH